LKMQRKNKAQMEKETTRAGAISISVIPINSNTALSSFGEATEKANNWNERAHAVSSLVVDAVPRHGANEAPDGCHDVASMMVVIQPILVQPSLALSTFCRHQLQSARVKVVHDLGHRRPQQTPLD